MLDIDIPYANSKSVYLNWIKSHYDEFDKVMKIKNKPKYQKNYPDRYFASECYGTIDEDYGFGVDWNSRD